MAQLDHKRAGDPLQALAAAPIIIDQTKSCPAPTQDTRILQANLQALARHSPRAARAIAEATPAQLEWTDTREPAPSASYAGRALASKRRPLDEAARLADSVNLLEHGSVLTLGFALGYHVRRLSDRCGEQAVTFVYEPDLGLLRAVLERIDHSEWLERPNLRLFTSADEPGAIQAALKGLEAFVSVGMTFLEHPPSQPRLGGSAGTFTAQLRDAIAAMRTGVITTMANAEITVRNTLMNLEHYINRPGIADLAGLCEGRPAVVVSAGPSLARNIQQLSKPGLRDRVCIIAVQTTLRPLLEAGITPHFVTAIDYHEISQRFYEGLSAEGVAGVQLIAEAKANPAILDAFPGQKRLGGDEILNTLLGDDLMPATPKLTPGATVAHLAYYFARFLKCDPVILIGQDLAFTDGQYYARGAAIHDVWAAELNSFNTLEMLEWQRIVRMRNNLSRAEDHLGRPVFTDVQMSTYLAQFERDFLADQEQGLTIIDATEGGVRKRSTSILPLAEALEKHARDNATTLPRIPDAEPLDRRDHLERVRQRVESVRRDVRRIARRSIETVELLRKMQQAGDDTKRINRLVAQVQEINTEVRALEPAFTLIQKVNQLGTFKRFRVDRELAIDVRENRLAELEEHVRRLDRDIANVTWTKDAADALDELLEISAGTLTGGAKRTRDIFIDPEPETTHETATSRETYRLEALVVVHPRSIFGRPTDLDTPFAGEPTLRRTLRLLADVPGLERAVVLALDEALIPKLQQLTAQPVPGLDVRLTARSPDRPEMIERTRRARSFSRDNWRGGLAGATVWDEIIDPVTLHAVMQDQRIDAAMLLAHDWCLLDTDLAGDLIQRHLESPNNLRFVFSQAAPGLSPMVVSRTTAADLAGAARNNLPLVGLSALLAYLPVQARPDPLAKPVCVQITPDARDLGLRAIPDDPHRINTLEQLATPSTDLHHLTERLIDPHIPPASITIELTTRRPTDRALADRLLGRARAPIDAEAPAIRSLLDEIAGFAPAAAITFAGAGDPLLHEELWNLIAHTRSLHLPAVHVRTSIIDHPGVIERVLEAGIDALSIEIHADSASTYERMHARDAFGLSLDAIEALLERRDLTFGVPDLAIVPRLLRCDTTYEDIEAFVDRWTMVTGNAVIDQLPRPVDAQRIQPLGKPRLAALRDAGSHMLIRADGSVFCDEHHDANTPPIANAITHSPQDAWRSLALRRRDIATEHPHTHHELWTAP